MSIPLLIILWDETSTVWGLDNAIIKKMIANIFNNIRKYLNLIQNIDFLPNIDVDDMFIIAWVLLKNL